MNATRFALVTRFAVLTLVCLLAATHARATMMLHDRGIFLAGPFPVPDITKAPSASPEAVFLAGSVANAPLFLNELVIAGNTGQFSNNGWAPSSCFDVNVVNGGAAVWISWNLTGTPYSLTHVSVNFDNNFYHVYQTSPNFSSEGSVEVTGNLRDAISHIHFFGVGRVPDAGGTIVAFSLSLAGILLFRRRLGRLPNANPGGAKVAN
jgi:hypothetical protein